MIVVKKFGGTSLKTKEARKLVINKIKEGKEKGEEVVVVVSAIGRSPDCFSTDRLIEIVDDNILDVEYKKTIDYKKKLDLMMSQGENISSIIISTMLESIGIKSKAINANKLGIITDDNFGNANVLFLNDEYLKEVVNEKYVPVITGFQGITKEGEVTTLGRGGSDFTAVVVGSMLNAEYVEIYTDVDGVMDKDPKIYKDAKKYKTLSQDKLISMCNLGAKVLHSKAAKYSKIKNIDIKILNTFNNESGTFIGKYTLDELE